jgi:hypothetical protein
LTFVRLDDIRGALINPRTHDVEHLAGLITQFGFIDPPVADSRTDRLVSGHGRIEALLHLKEQGEPTPDGVLIDDDGEWLIPVIEGWESSNDTTAHAAGLGVNTSHDRGGYDRRQQALLLEEIHTQDPGAFEALSFTAEELDVMIRSVVDADPSVESTSAAGKEDAREDTDSDEDEDEDEDEADNTSGAATNHAVTCPSCGHQFTPGS